MKWQDELVPPMTPEQWDEADRRAAAISRPGVRRRSGRPSLLPSQRKWATSVTIAPIDGEYALKQAELSGFTGNLSAGIGACIRRCREQDQAAIEAIKAAAERRDQDAVRSGGSAFDD